MKLRIIYLYPDELNLYGDTGNVEILFQRSEKRKIEAEVITLGIEDKVSSDIFSKASIVFMGGGPDSGQQEMYLDLIEEKGPFLKQYLEEGGTALFICGSYQLLGDYYKSADGSLLQGLSFFKMYTEHFGHRKPRCVGNIVCQLSESITNDPVFENLKPFSDKLIGFENHGGQTFLEESAKPLAKVLSGSGNNTKDKTEGIHYLNALGTYLHGPLLSKNPHLADYLIAKSLGLEKLSNLDDNIIRQAHTALLKRFI